MYLVVANILPPTFSLTQPLRDNPSGDGAQVVLRSMKSGVSWSLSGVVVGTWREGEEGVEVWEEAVPFTVALCPSAGEK